MPISFSYCDGKLSVNANANLAWWCNSRTAELITEAWWLKHAVKVENQDEIQDRPTLFMGNIISIIELWGKSRLCQMQNACHLLTTKEYLKIIGSLCMQTLNSTTIYVASKFSIPPNSTTEFSNITMLQSWHYFSMHYQNLWKGGICSLTIYYWIQ